MSDDEIFCEALELEVEAEQLALIETLCAEDSEQRKRILTLLETHRQLHSSGEDSQSILDKPDVVFQAFSGDDDLNPGKQVGKYLLCELIGQGATSLVFRAKQLMPMEREVALKLLKPGMDSQRILARFGLEQQVIRRLEHPGITRVYEAGFQDNGRPFFAMELVPSPLTITEYAERFGLDLRRRIELIMATCEIVQHAHQRGVIHRDLKPSNILMEGVPQSLPKPRIIDFGIAKVMQPGEDTGRFTTVGDRFGTPAYMSPEQALMSASSLDIRSDVYSLGVVLYELITGGTPRKVSSHSAVEPPWTTEAYWQYEVLPPSRVRLSQAQSRVNSRWLKRGGVLQGDDHSEKRPSGSERELDLIVLKAIAKDRQDRYQTVADLQRDLQRYLNGEPIEIAGLGLFYRTTKWINRNRTISIAAAVTLLTIILTSILTSSYAYRAYQAEHQVRLKLTETLNAQKELLFERDRAKEAMWRSQSLLRVFQVQTVTDRSLARFFKQMVEAAQRGQIEGLDPDRPLFTIEVEVLTKPHERLIVQGDWRWASDRFPTEIINTSFQISSREAAQAISESQVKTQSTQRSSMEPNPEIAKSKSSDVAKNREQLQTILLEELRAILPDDDPFIAEVLDNCGLQALERKTPLEAERFLKESVRIWGMNQKYLENLVQSQLFLAQAYLRNGQLSQSEIVLKEAGDSLLGISKDSPYFLPLSELHRSLQTELLETK